MTTHDWYFVLRDNGLPYLAVYEKDHLCFCIPVTHDEARFVKSASDRIAVHKFLFEKARATWEASK